MDIEPLQTILSLSKDKKETLLYFLSFHIRSIVEDLDYEDKDFYINDMIFCIKRNTLELEYSGRIFFIEEDKIGIKKSTYSNIYINPQKYYIFINTLIHLRCQDQHDLMNLLSV